MIRAIAFIFLNCLASGFVAADPVTGKWSACGVVRIGDVQIELSRKYLYPCAADGYTWTEISLDTAFNNRATFCKCLTSPQPPATLLLSSASSCGCRYGKWSYDEASGTLMITDTATVYYLVTSLTDSSMVLTKK